MKLNVNATSLALSTVFGIVFIICAVLFWIAPAFTLNLADYLVHGIDLSSIAETDVNFTSSLMGLILSVIIGYLIGYLFAITYNKFAK